MFCVGIFTTLFSTTPVFAEDLKSVKCNLCGQNHDLSPDAVDAFQRTVYEMNDLVYAAQLVDMSDAEDPSASSGMTMLKALEFDTTKEPLSNLWTTAETYYDSLKGFGILLAAVYSLIETLAHVSKDRLTLEYFMRELMKLIIAIIVVLNGFEIATGVVDIAREVFNSIGAASQTATYNSANCIYSMFTTSEDDAVTKMIGLAQLLIHVLTLLIPWLLLSVVKIVIAIVCWSRILELVVRIIFAPIGIADLFVHGTRSNGVKYLKQLLVCAIQGSVILVMIQAYGVIMSNMTVGVGQWTISVVLGIVLLTTVATAKNVASDICGV
jgi:hypothetical protein